MGECAVFDARVGAQRARPLSWRGNAPPDSLSPKLRLGVHRAIDLSYLDSPKPQYTVLEEYGARQVLHVVQSAVLAWHW